MDSPEQDVERLKQVICTLGVSLGDMQRLQAEVAALKELLRKYGKHMISCDVVMLPGVDQCTCGYDAALTRGGKGAI